MKILVVCASNICRSPYVEYLIKRAASEDPSLKEKIEWVKSSAVLNKMWKIHPMARVALKKDGFSDSEIDRHNPSYIWFNYRRFKEADVIIGMSRYHRMMLPPWLRKKYMTLSEAAGEGEKTVKDPYLEKTQEAYDLIMDELKAYTNKYIERLKA
jgi:protein-tyrosine-phosphatase